MRRAALLTTPIPAPLRLTVGALQREFEMEGGYFHSFPQIKTMGVDAVRAGIEGERRAAIRPRMHHQPIEESVTETLRAAVFVGHEIVDIQRAPCMETFRQTEPRHGANDAAVVFEKRESVTLGFGAADARDKIRGEQFRTQLHHNGKATGDVGVGFSEANGHGRGWL